jgi:hypothetical protein
MEEIAPYLLPAQARSELLALAAQADLLIIGELHGVQEVPRLILGLLPDLESLSYRGLGMEIPCELSEPIVDWVQGRTTDPTFFFEPRSTGDGRESVQAISLFRQMLEREAGWRLICFDSGSHQPNGNWEDRDAQMASNLMEQWQQTCPDHKIIAVCGNYHSRLAPGSVAPPEYWPAFAAQFVQAEPVRKVISIKPLFHGGAFHNFGDRPINDIPDPPGTPTITTPEFRPSDDASHTIELHLPFATPVTFFQQERLDSSGTP